METCINIGNRILSLEQFKHNINPPQTYADIFENLSLIGIIDKDFSVELKNMAKFRNKLVHSYWEIDHSFVYDLIQTKLNDIIKFMSITSDYVNK
ncbi:type VII toxin-antitoxin system HepT family RNase toxin [Clostridium peptidivorans]|uniref:type VII toxin-antitoxin system HepT family RNase toxin n=1 Tax=Clostridium peptidivorans TaxID=100174 RepID=UPI001A9A5322